jgi:menaquinone-9 beta-reductase
MYESTICIIGAGPGGTATALHLSHLGVSSILVDKATFPRDKVCGDGLTGKVVTILDRIDPGILQRFKATPLQSDSWGATFVMIGGNATQISYKKDYDITKDPITSYVTKRMDFDNFLLDECKKRDNITILEGTTVDTYTRTPEGWHLSNKKNTVDIKCTLVINAAGANSGFSRHIANIQMEPKHNAGAVRAYYKGVTGMHPDKFIELHFLKGYLPGYFWIFPLPNGEANVGFGMLTEAISKRKVNLKKTLQEIVDAQPEIASRFTNAEIIGDVLGYPLPLGSKRHKISGDNFMLIGDAAHLVDPLTGEGIGNAINSGFIAAEQAVKCIEAKDFSAEFMKPYDVRVWRVMGTELKISSILQKLLKYPSVFNFILKLAANNLQMSDLIYAMFKDVDVLKRLKSPIFWWKLITNKA